MMQYNRRIDISRLRMGWFARVATMLLAAALFVLLFGLATLAVAMVAATAVVTGVKVWWQSHLGRGGQNQRGTQGRTLEAEYEVLSSNSPDHGHDKSGKSARGKK